VDLLLLLLGVTPRFRIEYLVGSTVFAVILLRATGAVAVFGGVPRNRVPCARGSL
jgi:hypothetical protein